jgi:hypothetical protein
MTEENLRRIPQILNQESVNHVYNDIYTTILEHNYTLQQIVGAAERQIQLANQVIQTGQAYRERTAQGLIEITPEDAVEKLNDGILSVIAVNAYNVLINEYPLQNTDNRLMVESFINLLNPEFRVDLQPGEDIEDDQNDEDDQGAEAQIEEPIEDKSPEVVVNKNFDELYKEAKAEKSAFININNNIITLIIKLLEDIKSGKDPVKIADDFLKNDPKLENYTNKVYFDFNDALINSFFADSYNIIDSIFLTKHIPALSSLSFEELCRFLRTISIVRAVMIDNDMPSFLKISDNIYVEKPENFLDIDAEKKLTTYQNRLLFSLMAEAVSAGKVKDFIKITNIKYVGFNGIMEIYNNLVDHITTQAYTEYASINGLNVTLNRYEKSYPEFRLFKDLKIAKELNNKKQAYKEKAEGKIYENAKTIESLDFEGWL